MSTKKRKINWMKITVFIFYATLNACTHLCVLVRPRAPSVGDSCHLMFSFSLVLAQICFSAYFAHVFPKRNNLPSLRNSVITLVHMMCSPDLLTSPEKCEKPQTREYKGVASPTEVSEPAAPTVASFTYNSKSCSARKFQKKKHQNGMHERCKYLCLWSLNF